MAQLIGLTGLKRSGKDTAALRLMDRHQFVRVAFADPVKHALAELNPYVTRPSEDHRVSKIYAEINTLERRIVKAFAKHTVTTIKPSHVTMAVRRLDPLLAGDQRLTEVLGAVDGDWNRLKEDSGDVPFETAVEIRRLQQVLATEVAREMISTTIWVDTAMAAVRQSMDRGVSVVISDCRFDNEAQAIKNAGGIVARIDRPSLNGRPVDGHASEQGVADDLVDAVITNDGTLADLHASTDQLITKVLV